MNDLQEHKELCRNFAALFSYPDEQVKEHAAACFTQMSRVNPEGTTFMESFLNFIEANESFRIEEAFTGAFDLQALCHPYVGYQLCGESQQRTMFMLKLKELYQQHGFVTGHELPDHLTEVLRFIGSIDDQNCRCEIIQDGLLPALEKVTQGTEDDNHPYIALLNALQSFLAETATPANDRLQTDQQKECLS